VTTAGCDTIRWNFTRGLNDTRGALFVLNVGFQSSAGSLRQVAADSIGTSPLYPLSSLQLGALPSWYFLVLLDGGTSGLARSALQVTLQQGRRRIRPRTPC
jgi:hypothetical protein